MLVNTFREKKFLIVIWFASAVHSPASSLDSLFLFHWTDDQVQAESASPEPAPEGPV